MHLFKIFNFYNIFVHNCNILKFFIISNFFRNFYFLNNYFLFNELIWQEGLLIDFLQKKIIDNWIKKFVILSANLFNERLVFDKLVKFYLELLVWPMHKFFIFEFNNISSTLFVTIFFYFFFIFFLFFFYFFLLML